MRISVIGYGTFITQGYWKNKNNVEACLINNFIRIFPKNSEFPFILTLKESSFWALKFEVTEAQLKELDYYESIESGFFERSEIEIVLKNTKKIKAIIYIPSKQTIKSLNLKPETDLNDRWKEEIKKNPELVSKFPELVL